jgi:nuclear pore complex protein Nup53
MGLSHSLSSDPMSVDPQSNIASPSPAVQTSNTGTPAFGTPIRLAPSTSAFKRSGSKTSTPQGQAQNQSQGQLQRGWGPNIQTVSASASAPVIAGGSPAGMGAGTGVNTPGKGMLGQVSDLIFGW